MINTENTETVTQNFTRELHKTMAKFDLIDFSNREKSTKKSYVPDQLQTYDKVWIRIDRVRKQLEAPYSGPYMVLERTPKYFLIETNSNTHTQVSIDCLKPYIENKNVHKMQLPIQIKSLKVYPLKKCRNIKWKQELQVERLHGKRITSIFIIKTKNKTKQKLRLLVGEYCSITSLTKVSKWGSQY